MLHLGSKIELIFNVILCLFVFIPRQQWFLGSKDLFSGFQVTKFESIFIEIIFFGLYQF